MMSVPERQHSIPDTGAETTKPDSRLAFPSSPTAQGVGDGSWWPRTRDPAAELPALIAAGTDRLGMVARIALNADAWDTRPQWLGGTVQGCCRVIGERPRRASGCARGDRGSLRPLPASCGPARSDHLHLPDPGSDSGSRSQSSARCRDALARTALRNIGVVLRSSWR